MEFLGIGLPEIVLILIVALIILGPKDMQKTGLMVGRTLNKIIRSPTWRSIQRIWWEIRNAPTRIMRGANLEDIQETIADLQKSQSEILKSIKTGEIQPPDFHNKAPKQGSHTLSSNQIIPDPGTEEKTSGISTWVTPSTKTGSVKPDATDSTADLSNWITPPTKN